MPNIGASNAGKVNAPWKKRGANAPAKPSTVSTRQDREPVFKKHHHSQAVPRNPEGEIHPIAALIYMATGSCGKR